MPKILFDASIDEFILCVPNTGNEYGQYFDGIFVTILLCQSDASPLLTSICKKTTQFLTYPPIDEMTVVSNPVVTENDSAANFPFNASEQA